MRCHRSTDVPAAGPPKRRHRAGSRCRQPVLHVGVHTVLTGTLLPPSSRVRPELYRNDLIESVWFIAY